MDPEVMGLMEDEDTMPCGCVDYHVADCPTVSPPSNDRPDPDDWRYEDEDWTSEILGA